MTLEPLVLDRRGQANPVAFPKPTHPTTPARPIRSSYRLSTELQVDMRLGIALLTDAAVSNSPTRTPRLHLAEDFNSLKSFNDYEGLDQQEGLLEQQELVKQQEHVEVEQDRLVEQKSLSYQDVHEEQGEDNHNHHQSDNAQFPVGHVFALRHRAAVHLF
ncbi:hypothetical protein JCM10295v2_006802 [Rhodotorula toruloides]